MKRTFGCVDFIYIVILFKICFCFDNIKKERATFRAWNCWIEMLYCSFMKREPAVDHASGLERTILFFIVF